MEQVELWQDAARQIESFIEQLDVEGRDPDRYECDWLIRAIAWFDGGRFEDCLTDMLRARAQGAARDHREGGVLSGCAPLTAAELRESWNERKLRLRVAEAEARGLPCA